MRKPTPVETLLIFLVLLQALTLALYLQLAGLMQAILEELRKLHEALRRMERWPIDVALENKKMWEPPDHYFGVWLRRG